MNIEMRKINYCFPYQVDINFIKFLLPLFLYDFRIEAMGVRRCTAELQRRMYSIQVWLCLRCG